MTKSSVTLIPHEFSDLMVVNAARVSFGKRHETFDQKKDTRLINYLMREGHWSPVAHPHGRILLRISFDVLAKIVSNKYLLAGLTFNKINEEGDGLVCDITGSLYGLLELSRHLEHGGLFESVQKFCPVSSKAYLDNKKPEFKILDEVSIKPADNVFTFFIKAPVFVARQLGKHQIGLVWNEESRRYIDGEIEFWEPDYWRQRAPSIKQGSLDVSVPVFDPQNPLCLFCNTNLSSKGTYTNSRKRYCSSKCQNKGYRKFSYQQARFVAWKAGAAYRGIEFSISPEDVVWCTHCPILGIELDYTPLRGGHRDNTPSLDRIDTTKGYIPGNVHIVSSKANRAKSNLTLDELRSFGKWAVRDLLGIEIESSFSYKNVINIYKNIYEYLLESGVCPEQARSVLPQSLMVSWYWTGTREAFERVVAQRTKPDAQRETREVAEQIAYLLNKESS